MDSTMLFHFQFYGFLSNLTWEMGCCEDQRTLEFTRRNYNKKVNTSICVILLNTRSTFWSLTFQIGWVSKYCECRGSGDHKSSEILKLKPSIYNSNFWQIHSSQHNTMFSLSPSRDYVLTSYCISTVTPWDDSPLPGGLGFVYIVLLC